MVHPGNVPKLFGVRSLGRRDFDTDSDLEVRQQEVQHRRRRSEQDQEADATVRVHFDEEVLFDEEQVEEPGLRGSGQEQGAGGGFDEVDGKVRPNNEELEDFLYTYNYFDFFA